MINSYRSEKFIVSAIKCDGEGAIVALENFINSQGIKYNSSSKSQHVPQVERKIRQVKERVRSHISVLPYILQCNLQLVLACAVLYTKY